MKEYHKINTIFKRDMAGDKKLIVGQWSQPEFEYLQNNEWEFTEKVDGTNIRVNFALKNDILTVSLGGRTDNASIPPHLNEELKKIFFDSYLKFAVLDMFGQRGIDSMTLYGEGYGPKIQGGGKYRDTPGFVLFDVMVGDWWLERDSVDDLGLTLGIDTVPVIGHGTLHDAVDIVKGTMWSTWGQFEAEGIVARPRVSMFDRAGRRVIAKIKGRDFL